MIPAWLSGLWAKVAFVGAFVGLLLLAAFRLIGIGRKVERGATAERINEQVREARNVENRVDGAGADELERLRRKWER
ncbi:MAG TPA: hypothetical protein VGE09_08600 [Pseudoxanthomonas sp.]